MEEKTNSKLREVEIRVEDCLQTVSPRPAVLSAICRRSSSEEEVGESKSAECDDSTLDDTSNGSSVQQCRSRKSATMSKCAILCRCLER